MVQENILAVNSVATAQGKGVFFDGVDSVDAIVVLGNELGPTGVPWDRRVLGSR